MPNHASISYAEHYLAEDEPLQAARSRAADVDAVPIGPGGGAMLRFLAALLAARSVVEFGTGCGVSGIWLLRGMTPDGILTSIDAQADHQRLARLAFTEAGLAPARFRLIAGKALDVAPRLTDAGYDLVFCDAEKSEYPDYLTQAVRLLRPGGVVAFDNALWHDRVADASARDPDTLAVRAVAQSMLEHPALVPAMLPCGDGLLIAVKRG